MQMEVNKLEYIKVNGNENDIITALAEYMSESSAKLIINMIPFYIEILNGEEFYIKEEVRKKEQGLGLIIPSTNYYINIKMTTLALLGLLIDIRFTQGFSSFVLNNFGVTADAIRKISNIEKCVLLLIINKSILCDNKNYIVDENAKCVNYAQSCTDRQYNKCVMSTDKLRETIGLLEEKNIIKQNGNKLKYIF